MTIQVYYFSPHEPNKDMLKIIGGNLNQQFRGTIKNLKGNGKFINFTELEEEEGEVTREQILSPGDLVIISHVASFEEQAQWLHALHHSGAILLIPVIEDGVFKQLLWIKELALIRDTWVRR